MQSAKLNPLALGSASAIVSAFIMLLIGIFGNIGIYDGAALMMQQWHMFFSFSLGGILLGMIEAAIISFIFMYLLGWVYNLFIKE